MILRQAIAVPGKFSNEAGFSQRKSLHRIAKALKAGDTLKQDHIVVIDREGMYLSNATYSTK